MIRGIIMWTFVGFWRLRWTNIGLFINLPIMVIIRVFSLLGGKNTCYKICYFLEVDIKHYNRINLHASWYSVCYCRNQYFWRLIPIQQVKHGLFFLVEEEREYKYIEALTKIKKGNGPLCLLMSLFVLLYIWKESSMKIQWDFEIQQQKKKNATLDKVS